MVLTDGFTGNAVLKAMEGVSVLLDSRPASTRAAVLLGVAGAVVVGHGAASAQEVAEGVALAARTVREAHLTGQLAAAPLPDRTTDQPDSTGLTTEVLR